MLYWSMNDDSVGRPSPKQIQDELNKQEEQFGEILEEDNPPEDIDSLEKQATGHDHGEDGLPADMPLGKHTAFDHTPDEADKTNDS